MRTRTFYILFYIESPGPISYYLEALNKYLLEILNAEKNKGMNGGNIITSEGL